MRAQAKQPVVYEEVHSFQDKADVETLRNRSLGCLGAKVHERSKRMVVGVLTGGSDPPYVYGLATSLLAQGIHLEIVGSDELDLPEFRDNSALKFLNLRGDNQPGASLVSKVTRILRYYVRLVWYAGTTKAKIFHILWNNRFETFDRTVLMLYYRLLRKTIVMTVHNVNAARRDKKDGYWNRATLRMQYRLANHLFVHTENMRAELINDFAVPGMRITVIPFGINNAAPRTDLTACEAKQRLGLRASDKTILFFGRITPYKGLEYLIAAFRRARKRTSGLRLVIAGRIDRCEDYWRAIREDIQEETLSGEILVRAEFIPEAETEVYFKAADVLALPYRDIYQSGVLFLAQSFGLPVLASDAGSLKDEVVEGWNGFTFGRESDAELAEAIDRYFESDLYAEIEGRRSEIRDRATRKHSWSTIARVTAEIYHGLDRKSRDEASPECRSSARPMDCDSLQ